MKEWLTAREIAAEALLDLPVTERGVQLFAKEAGWADYPGRARTRAGRGGGMEYHIQLLPMLAQMDYARRHAAIGRAEPEPEAAAQPEEGLTERSAKERDARLVIVNALHRFTRSGLTKGARLAIFTDHYNRNMVAVEPWVREIIPVLTRRSLERWKCAKSRGHALGFDRAKARKGTGILDRANGGRLKQFALGLIAHQPHLSAYAVRDLCRSEFSDCIKAVSKGVEQPIQMPPVRTFQHFIAALKADHKVELVKLTNPDQYRSAYAPSGTGMLRHVSEANALWMIDASPVDALCTDGRHAVYACIDIATRRAIFSISKTPRASAVALLVRKAILAWGVPKTIKTDNGSDFVAQDTKRLFAALDVEMDLSDAYTPQQKGHVERVIRTFQHEVGPLLPGFVGHSVSDRKAIESRKSFAQRLGESDAETFGVTLTGTDLSKHVDEWASTVYAMRIHAGLKGKSPFKAALASTAPKRTVDERALDLLLMPVAGKDGLRTVTKFGIRIDHYHYMTPHILPGAQVLVRQDPNDLGRAYAFAADGGQYLGVATCPELSGLHPETFVREAKAMQAELISNATRQIKADMKKIAAGPALIERVLEVARRDMPNVIALPKREEAHSTAQISAAIEAMSGEAQAEKPWEEMNAAEHRRLLAEFEEKVDFKDVARELEEMDAAYQRKVEAERLAGLPANVTRLPETALERYRRAWRLLEQRKTGLEGDPEDLWWLTGYQQTPEFRAQRDMHEAFGDGYLS